MLHENLDLVLLIVLRRTLFSLVAVALVLAGMAIAETPWWVRTLTGTTYVAVLGLLLTRLRAHLPRGISRRGRGWVDQSSLREKFSMALVVLLAVNVGVLAFASASVAAVGAAVLLRLVRAFVIVGVIRWILRQLGVGKDPS